MPLPDEWERSIMIIVKSSGYSRSDILQMYYVDFMKLTREIEKNESKKAKDIRSNKRKR